MSKKKIITLALVAMIAILSITSASLAYFTDTKTAENTFTMGNVKIVLDDVEKALERLEKENVKRD